MIALTDQQLDMVVAAATPLPPEKRAILLKRVAAHLQREIEKSDEVDQLPHLADFGINPDDPFWHKADIPITLPNVRFRG
jgi:hypothetical protein